MPSTELLGPHLLVLWLAEYTHLWTASLAVGRSLQMNYHALVPQILLDMGFEFGEVAQMTDEWENRFDQLLEWMLWNREEVRLAFALPLAESCV